MQYYITEAYSENDELREHATQSDTLYNDIKETQGIPDRFAILNDMLVSISMQDEATASDMLEEYLYQDFCARELFRVL